MDTYKLYNVCKPLLNYLAKLSNWYVRLNRNRMRGDDGVEEQRRSLNVLFDALLNTTTLMACITPFLTEFMYQNLRNGISDEHTHLKAPSIHFLEVPTCNEQLIDEAVEKRVARMQSAIETGRLIRDRVNMSLKTPLQSVTLIDADPVALADFQEVASYITDELNCLELITQANEDEFVNYKCEPDNREIGSVLKKAYDKELKAKIANLSSTELKAYLKDGFIMVGDIKIEPGWLKVEKVFNEKYTADKDYACATSDTAAVMLNTVTNEKLQFLATAREITSKIQKQRKALGL